MNTDLLTERLEKVGWQLSANQLEGILEDASKDNVAYSDFLNSILMTEIEHRESTELSKRINRARLPYFKTLEDFDFAFQPSINEKRVREVMTCRFIDNGFNVLLLGPTGVRKTHLAISIAAEAVTKGYRTSFITANDFVEECQKAEKSGLLPRIICILQYKCGSYAMLVNDDERPPKGGRSFFCNISEHNSAQDFDKAPES